MEGTLRKKILEAGVVSKEAVAQMEQWKMVPAGSAANVRSADIQKVRDLRQDLEVRDLPRLAETLLDLKKIMAQAHPISLGRGTLRVNGVLAGTYPVGRYIIEIAKDTRLRETLAALLKPQTQLIDNQLPVPRNQRSITAVSVFHHTIDREGQKVVEPTHWLCDTVSEFEDVVRV